MLEPDRSAPERPTASRPRYGSDPGALRAVLRGLAKRCPRCGERDLFARRLKIRDRCSRCELRLEREEGGFLGAVAINYTATTLAWAVFLAIWLPIDLPGVAVAPLTLASLAFVALFALLFFPFSKTIWAAVDYLVLRTSPDYVRADPRDQAEGDGGRL